MNKIEVTTCGSCPFCIVDNNRIICYANLRINDRLMEVDDAMLDEDRLESCPLDEGLLVVSKDLLYNELEEEDKELLD